MANKEDLRVIVVGPNWYGNWVDYFYKGLVNIGVDARVIYTNTLFGSPTRYSSDSAMHSFEKLKRTIFKMSPWLFGILKGIRKSVAEVDLLRQLQRIDTEDKTTFVVFIWTPPTVGLLRKLKGSKGLKLVYWMGEPLSRDKRWRATLDYFDHLFIVDHEDWIGDLGGNRGKVTLLPLSSTKEVFKPMELTKKERKKYECDVSFVGLYRRERADTIESIKKFNFKIYGYGWEDAGKESPWLEGKVMGPAQADELVKIFNGAKVSIGSLGISFTEKLPTATQRVFDIALSGGFQLSQKNRLTKEIFGDSVPLFASKEEFEKLLDYYMSRPDERDRLAKKSREIALRNTWDERAEESIKVFETLL